MNNNQRCQPLGPSALKQRLALLYFRAALEDQRYEDCPGLVDQAKSLGAGQRQIRVVIENYVKRRERSAPANKPRFGRRKNRRF